MEVRLLQGFTNMVAQSLGAIIGAGFLKAILPDSFQDESLLGANAVPPESSRGKAFLSTSPLICRFVVLLTKCMWCTPPPHAAYMILQFRWQHACGSHVNGLA